jgi:hypothetical protein
MSDAEIIRMAVKCGLVTTGNRDSFYVDALGEFARMVAAAEREACARICDGLHWEWHMGDNSGPKECANAIRERGEQ